MQKYLHPEYHWNGEVDSGKRRRHRNPGQLGCLFKAVGSETSFERTHGKN